MSVTIVAYQANGISHYVREASGGGIDWDEDQSRALQFASGAAADSFMSGKSSLPYVKISVSGITHAGRKSANL